MWIDLSLIELGLDTACMYHQTCTHLYCNLNFQLKEVVVKSVFESKDPKVKEECKPGKPISVFLSSPYE